jgi:TolB-like protein
MKPLLPHAFAIACTFLFVAASAQPIGAKEGKAYEEGIRELSESIVTDVVKEKHPSVAVMDFTDLNGKVTALGRFVAEELSSSLVITGEVQVVDRTQFGHVLEKEGVSHGSAIESGNLKKLGVAANVHGIVTGTVTDMGGAVRVTAKVLSTDNGRVITTARTSLTKTGPIAEFTKPEPKQPTAKVEKPKESTGPQLPSYAGDMYRLTITGTSRSAKLLTLDLLVENTSPRDLRIACKLMDTYLKDEAGAEWRQDADHNREGICIRGLKLMASTKQRATITFMPRTDADGKVFALHFHETEPRRDVLYTISGIKTEADAGKAAP